MRHTGLPAIGTMLRTALFSPSGDLGLLSACGRAIKTAGTVVLLAAALVASYAGIVRYLGNIHVVVTGKLYRSAQLDRAQFESVIGEYGIKSILNLRGNSPGESWYEDEMAVSNARGVKYFNYGIWASNPVTKQQIAEILNIIREAPKPLLVHCDGGADRSGLVAALYLSQIENRPAEEAIGQLSLLYGHIPWLMRKTKAMDDSFWGYINPDSASGKGTSMMSVTAD
jgi:protein tyrosine/serine phosphatase